LQVVLHIVEVDPLGLKSRYPYSGSRAWFVGRNFDAALSGCPVQWSKMKL
jgi:hypothetical protein